METADVDLVSTERNDLPYDLRVMILSWLPVECSYMFRIVAKEWKDLLSSQSFIDRWSELPINNHPRLVLCDYRNPEIPCMSFCFRTLSWIKPCFTLSFLKDSILETDIMSSDQGTYLVSSLRGRLIKVCNPHIQTFIKISIMPSRVWDIEHIVVDDNKNR